MEETGRTLVWIANSSKSAKMQTSIASTYKYRVLLLQMFHVNEDLPPLQIIYMAKYIMRCIKSSSIYKDT